MKPIQHDRLDVVKDDEEIEVYNWVNISRLQKAIVRASNPTVERFDDDAEIGAGDSSFTPDAVTHWVANELWHEFDIEVEDHGIDVIDIESDEVTVI